MSGLKIVFALLVSALLASALATDVAGEDYIIGGRTATRYQFPWIVSLRTRLNLQYCGGFILSDQWVGSSALCASGIRPQGILVVTGAHTRTDGNRHTVSRIVTHPRFNKETRIFDVSVFQTVERMAITAQGPVRAIRFPTGPVIHDGTTVYAAGWGLVQRPGQEARVLQYKSTRTISQQQCIQRSGPERRRLIHTETVCTLNPVGKGVCLGDTGGPLVDQQGNCLGIISAASWDRRCAQGLPDIYAKLWTAIPFFRQVSQNTIPNLPAGPR